MFQHRGTDAVAVLDAWLEWLDGYWVLADLIDRPQLRAESLGAARCALQGHRTGNPWLAVYGLASAAFGAVLLMAGAYGWWLVVGDLLRSLTSDGPAGWPVALPLGFRRSSGGSASSCSCSSSPADREA